ncbi:unnamed protein product [Peronospora belbahrii]|uniref:Uncharacterized protein n=1 Tax=Peronospora belbahrii TaxID=622444 RepID=A0AAU9KKR7_9STRA|nr:unnamed protein product [Peronospora belbahrii]
MDIGKKHNIDMSLVFDADRGELDKLLVKTLKSASSSVAKNRMIAIAAGVLGVAAVYSLFNLPISKPVHSTTNTVGTTSSGAA